MNVEDFDAAYKMAMMLQMIMLTMKITVLVRLKGSKKRRIRKVPRSQKIQRRKTRSLRRKKSQIS